MFPTKREDRKKIINKVFILFVKSDNLVGEYFVSRERYDCQWSFIKIILP